MALVGGEQQKRKNKVGALVSDNSGDDDNGGGASINLGMDGEGVSVVPDSLEGPNLEVVLPRREATPTSGIALLLEVNNDDVLQQGDQVVSESTKLLDIQKQVGFCYQEADDAVVKVLVKDEHRDSWAFLPSEGASGGILSIW
ncbi:hypothetical protein A2U01_0012459, partial [Trifolium medium]|nr:hypothetical protein [Trifolium medium]